MFKDIQTHGYFYSSYLLQDAFASMSDSFKMTELNELIGKIESRGAYRTTDKLLKKTKREGLVFYKDGYWHKTEKGKNIEEHNPSDNPIIKDLNLSGFEVLKEDFIQFFAINKSKSIKIEYFKSDQKTIISYIGGLEGMHIAFTFYGLPSNAISKFKQNLSLIKNLS